ncbi:arylesterase [Sphingobium algorifonticola]|uniref:Arylesterase n=1 Tax=Sphingobium algorifonticola TaxID=2008318 RepID=A0A437J963_9SPHN|nr:arylesterase [Sphingobium algorifonticola]RVT42018.1 arylesterase [Sphingobium algorifonticola]
MQGKPGGRSRLYGALRHLVQVGAMIGLMAAFPAQAAEKLVLAFGDSLTAGYGLKPNESFPVQLQTALRRQGVAVRVHNAGVSGDTTAQGKARLGWVLKSLGRKPDLVIVQLGGNDMLRGIDPVQTRANMNAILADLKRRNIKVLLAGMLASPNLGSAYRAKFDPIWPTLAKQYRVPLYPFFLKGVTGNRSLLLKDNLHPTAQGVGVVVRGVAPVVKGLL